MIKKYFSPLCLVVSSLMLIYVFYRSEIHWKGNQDYYLKYYIISIILILFSIVTFFINQNIKLYLIIILSSIALSLYSIESYFILKKNKLSAQTVKEYEKKTKFEFYKNLKKEDENIVLVVAPKNQINSNNEDLFALSGISNSKTINCNENGYYSINQSDRYGFNNPDGEWEKKEIKYLLVGDSFAYGSCVNRPNDIASILRTLSNKSVLNLGYNGNGPLIEYATLREYLSSNTKNVLWLYYGKNDTADLERELNSEILKKYLRDQNFTQNLKEKQNQIDEKLKSNIKEREKKSIYIKSDFLRLKHVRILIESRYTKPLLQTQFKEILKLTKELSHQNNSNFYFFYLPGYARYKTNYVDNDYQKVKYIVEELAIPFIDIHKEVFEKEKNPLKFFPFEMSGHYNVEGYRKVAEAIYKLTSSK